MSKKPVITVSLFEPKEVPSLGVNIVPQEISDLSNLNSQKTFLFRLDLVSAETVIIKAYAELLAVVKICQSLLNVLKNRDSFGITTRFQIVNQNRMILFVLVVKTL